MKKIFGVFIILLGLTIPMACSNNPTSPALTPTPIPTATFWANYTATNTVTPTITPTITSTNLGGITSTPTLTATNTPTLTITSTASNSPTLTPMNTPTNTPTPFSSPTPTFVTSFVSTNVQYPNGLALLTSGSGTFYVAEGENSAVSAVEILNSTGGAVAQWTGFGGTPFGEPYGVAAVTQSGGQIFVIDRLNNAVYEFTAASVTVRSWSSWIGGAVTVFNHPEGIAVDSSTNCGGGPCLYVADTGNNTVEEFDLSGNYITQWGSGSGSFSSPSAVATDSSNNLYVADAGNELIQVFNGSSWLTPLSTVPGSDLFGLSVDATGNIYAADVANSQVEEYNPSGVLIRAWNGASTTPNTSFSSPDGIVISGGNIFVTDFDNGNSGTGSVEAFGQ